MATSENGSDGQYHDIFKSKVDNLLKWEDENTEFLTRFDINSNFIKYSEELERLLMKKAKANSNVVFVGQTSSGKSSLINSLLGIDVVPSGIGHSIQPAVRIQTTLSPTSYFQYCYDEERRYIDFYDEESLENFHDIMKMNSDDNSHSSQCIEVYIADKLIKSDGIISRTVSFLDTPGMKRDVFQSKEVRKKVLEADVLILVVDIISWSDNDFIARLLDDQGFSVKPNVIVAINKCDTLLEEANPRRRENVKNNVKNDLTNLLISKGRTSEEANNSIFFVSAQLISKLKTSDNRSQIIETQDELVDEFHKLEQTILTAVKKERIHDALERWSIALNKELDRIASEINTIKEYLKQLNVHIAESAKKVKDMVNPRILRTAFVEDLYELKSGRAKVVDFLNYCKVDQFEDIKDAIITKSVNMRISKFVDCILREEIDHTIGINSENCFESFFELLDPIDQSSISSIDEEIIEIEESIRNIQLRDDKIEELEANYNDLCMRKEKEKEERKKRIFRIKLNNERSTKTFIMESVVAVIGAVMSIHSYSTSEGVLSPAIAISTSLAAASIYETYKIISGRKDITFLEQAFRRYGAKIENEEINKRIFRIKLNNQHYTKIFIMGSVAAVIYAVMSIHSFPTTGGVVSPVIGIATCTSLAAAIYDAYKIISGRKDIRDLEQASRRDDDDEIEKEEMNKRIFRIKLNNERSTKTLIMESVVAVIGTVISIHSFATTGGVVSPVIEIATCTSLAAAIYDAYKIISGRKDIKDLEQSSRRDDDDEIEKEEMKVFNFAQKSNKLIKELEMKATLENLKRSKVHAEHQMIADYEQNHKTVLTELYMSVITFVSKALRKRLDKIVDYLDHLQISRMEPIGEGFTDGDNRL